MVYLKIFWDYHLKFGYTTPTKKVKPYVMKITYIYCSTSIKKESKLTRLNKHPTLYQSPLSCEYLHITLING